MGRPRDVTNRAVGRVRSAAQADGADKSGLSALISVHALHAAGDALVAIALAGTLFFSVPIGEARTRVALYLLLTMLPFSLLVPVAGPLLDRFPHGRRNVLALTTGARGLLTWVMAGAVASLGLYPLALAVLVLSRAYGVARCAAVPRVKPPTVGLVSANARLNVAAVLAGSVAAAVGAALTAATGSSSWALRLASVLLILGAVLSLRLPAQVDEAPVASLDAAARFRLLTADSRLAAPLGSAIALRAVAGLLTIFLAFLLRAEGASRPVVIAVVGAAALGQLLGTGLAARLPEHRSTLLAILALVGPLVASLGAALTAGDALWVIAAAGATGVSVSLSKFALDAALQAHIVKRSLGSAFSRSETALQLSWVVGGGIAVLIPVDASLGFSIAAVLPVLGVVLARELARRSPHPASP